MLQSVRAGHGFLKASLSSSHNTFPNFLIKNKNVSFFFVGKHNKFQYQYLKSRTVYVFDGNFPIFNLFETVGTSFVF